jgi:hypothetical protein
MQRPQRRGRRAFDKGNDLVQELVELAGDRLACFPLDAPVDDQPRLDGAPADVDREQSARVATGQA